MGNILKFHSLKNKDDEFRIISMRPSAKEFGKSIVPAPLLRRYWYHRYAKKIRKNYLEFGENSISAPIVLAAFPKAGSTWISHLIADCLPGFIFYESRHHAYGKIGKHYNITTPVIQELSEALVVLHTHTPPSDNNIENIQKLGGRIIVLVRDVRDVAVSAYHHILRYGDNTTFIESGVVRDLPWTPMRRSILHADKKVIINEIIQNLLPGLSAYALDWVAKNETGLGIHILRYEDMISNPEYELEKILEFVGAGVDSELISRGVKMSDPAGTYKNKFRKGGWGSWKQELTRDQIRRCNLNFQEFLGKFSYL